MGFADLWSRTLVYFGIAEEEDYWDEDGYATNEELERAYVERDRPNVRRLPRRRYEEVDDWTSSQSSALERSNARALERSRAAEAAAAAAADARPRRLAPAPAPSVRVHLVVPRSFNDAQQIADKFKEAMPVILNLQTTDAELSKRLIDFTSGLT